MFFMAVSMLFMTLAVSAYEADKDVGMDFDEINMTINAEQPVDVVTLQAFNVAETKTQSQEVQKIFTELNIEEEKLPVKIADNYKGTHIDSWNCSVSI